MTEKCPKCDSELGVEIWFNYDIIGEVITCPSCKTKFIVEYDEDWDGEEENQVWRLEKALAQEG